MKLNISIYAIDSGNFLSVIFLVNTWCIYINKIVRFPWIIFIFSSTSLVFKDMVIALPLVSPSIIDWTIIFSFANVWALFQFSFEALSVSIDLRTVLWWSFVNDISFSYRSSGIKKINCICYMYFLFLSVLQMVGRNIITIGKWLAR